MRLGRRLIGMVLAGGAWTGVLGAASLPNGTFTGWCESGHSFEFDKLAPGTSSKLAAYWSVGELGGGKNWGAFFADPGTRVALVDDGKTLAEIRDASRYRFSEAVMPVRKDAIVLLHQPATGAYAALKVSGIFRAPEGKCPLQDAEMEGAWVLQTDGSGDFSQGSF